MGRAVLADDGHDRLNVTAARRAALDILRAVRRGGLADRALARARAGLEPGDRAWLQELVYGTLRLRGRLDHTLETRVRRGLEDLEPDVRDLLRLGAYQLLAMDGVPDYAAVSQTVELAKEAAPRASGLVNAVLKATAREGWRPAPPYEDDPVAHLTRWGSHPRWLVERWLACYGDGARVLVELDNARPDTYLRPVGVPVAEALQALDAAGIGAEPVALAPDAIRLDPGVDVAAALAAAPAVVQDPAAGLVARYTAPPRGATVLDLCAAPGGKTLALAGESGVRVVATDRSRTRLGRLLENADRLAAQVGRLPLLVAVADARAPATVPGDVVLVDAPCTGTGTLRRHPDGRWRVGPRDLETLAALQREMLDAAADRVRPGGLLVYATCSLEPEENEDQVAAFLDRWDAFASEPAPPGLDPSLLQDDRLVVLPHEHGMDGAYAARLRRRG